MEILFSGKDASTAFQLIYSSVKDEAKDEMMGYREVEPQNRMLERNASASSPAGVGVSWPGSACAVVWGSAAAGVGLEQATRERAMRTERSNAICFFIVIVSVYLYF
jgi:hypothetical protein